MWALLARFRCLAINLRPQPCTKSARPMKSEKFVNERVISLDPRPPSWERKPSMDCLRMRGVFRILSSKFDRKLNYPRRARTFW